MGKVDDMTKEYIDDPKVFADIINGYVYNGEQVVLPENLEERDTVVLLGLHNSGGENALKQISRDKYKYLFVKTDGKAAYVIIGIEGQATINYAMPVKCMSYDIGEYNKQVKRIQDMHEEKGDFKERRGGEFLWKFFKEDYLIPVITVVVNFSPEPWDGPTSLHDMFHIKDPKILSMVENYKIHLIDPHTMSFEEMEKFKTNLREVMTFIKLQKDKKKLREMVENNPRFQHIKRNAKKMIEVCTNWKFKKEKEEKEEEESNMCLALREMVEDAKAEGREEMRQEMCQALSEMVEDAKAEGREEIRQEMRPVIVKGEGRDTTLLEDLKSIMDSFCVSFERALEVLKVPKEKSEYYRQLIG